MAISRDILKRLRIPKRQQPATTGDGPATKCEACGEILIKKTLEENLSVCPLSSQSLSVKISMYWC